MSTLDRPEFHDPSEDKSTKLKLENQFYFYSSVQLAEKASPEQLRGLFKTLLLSYLSQQEYYRSLVKTTWGIGDGFDKRTDNKECESEDSGN